MTDLAGTATRRVVWPSWPRLALALLLVWWTLRLASTPSGACFLDLVNLAFHEAGHLFCTPFGSTVHYLGGTLGQLAVPVAVGLSFVVRRGQMPGAAFGCWWLGESLHNVSVYMADARELALPLVGGGDHDWNELFFRFGVLDGPSVTRISSAAHLAGVVIMVAGLAWTLFFVLPAAAQSRLREPLVARWPRVAPFLED